jgi:hypothetical protein
LLRCSRLWRWGWREYWRSCHLLDLLLALERGVIVSFGSFTSSLLFSTNTCLFNKPRRFIVIKPR